MTRDQAIELLAKLTATWPRPTIDEANAEIWIGYLRDVTLDHGAVALDDFVREGKERRPELAEFYKRAKAVARRDRERARPASLPAQAGDYVPDNERQLSHLEEARQALRETAWKKEDA